MSKIGDVTRKRRLADPVRVRFYGYWRSLRWRSQMTGRPLSPGALDGFRAWLNTAGDGAPNPLGRKLVR